MNIENAVSLLIKKSNNKRDNRALLSRDDLLKIEQDLNIEIPKDYSYFLTNAANIFHGYYSPFSTIIEIQEASLVLKKLNVFDIPFCEDNGDYFLINSAGTVKYFSHNGYSKEYWSSLGDWISKVWIANDAE